LVAQLLDDEMSAADFEHAYPALLADPALRDRLSTLQLIGDSLRGRTVPDDGYTLRILERLPRSSGPD
jgi:negative regulator of sigma E activity